LLLNTFEKVVAVTAVNLEIRLPAEIWSNEFSKINLAGIVFCISNKHLGAGYNYVIDIG